MRISVKWQILKIMIMHSVGVAAVKWTFYYASDGSIIWCKSLEGSLAQSMTKT